MAGVAVADDADDDAVNSDEHGVVESDGEVHSGQPSGSVVVHTGTVSGTVTTSGIKPTHVYVTGNNTGMTTSGTSAINMDVAEVAGSSMGGHNPKADINPERKLVRSFGKWAKGKQSICVRVLTEKHPELCAHRPGGCNALCAWMKDQFLGTTKWRKGRKQVMEGDLLTEESGIFIDYGDGGVEDFIGGPLVVDIIAESEAREAKDAVAKPDWATDEVLKTLADSLDTDIAPTVDSATEADVVYERITTRLRKLLQDRGATKVQKALGRDYSHCYVTIKETHPDHVIYQSDEDRGLADAYDGRLLYRQDYSVSDDGDVTLTGSSIKVEVQYVATKNETEATTGDPYDTDYYSGEQLMEAPVAEATGLAKLGSWQKAQGLSVFVRKTDGKIIMGPAKFKGKQFSDVSGSTAKEAETKGTPTSASSDDHVFVDIETAKGNVTVQMRRSDGLITSGPRSLKGSYLPPIPDDLVGAPATTADASGSTAESVAVEAVMESSAASNYDVNEIFAFDHAVVESAATTTTGSKPKTPSGLEVDAIIRIITPGPGNARDGFYYPSDAISSTHKVFEGLKMYADHLSEKEERDLNGRPRSVKDWVSTVKETWVDDQGRCFGGTDFVDEVFEKKAKRGKDDIGVSVRAGVKAKPGKVNGRSYKVVEGFTTGRTVDWVTEAGARGGLEEIAESAKIGEVVADKALKDMTLDELQAERPDLFVEYAERIETAEGESTAVVESPTAEGDDGEFITVDDIKGIVESAVKTAIEADRGRQRQRDKLTNRERLEAMVTAESSFRDATKSDLKRELADVTFEDEVGESGEIVKTGTQLFEEHVKARIDERKKELAEYTGETVVIDTGASGTSVLESGTRVLPAAGGVHDSIERSLGLVPDQPAQSAETAAA